MSAFSAKSSDLTKFLVVIAVSALGVAWILYDGMQVVMLNAKLRSDPVIQHYPYPFRVIRQANDVIQMGIIHGPEYRLEDTMRLIFPELRDLDTRSLKMQRAQQRYARVMARARDLALQSAGAQRVEWIQDDTWLRLYRRQQASD